MGKPAPFTVDTKRAGSAPLDVQVNDNRGESVPVTMVDNKDGTYNCSYTPVAGSKHTVQVSFVHKLSRYGLIIVQILSRSTTEVSPARTVPSEFLWLNQPMPVTCLCLDLAWRRASSPTHPRTSTSTADRQDQVKLVAIFKP